MTKIDRLERVQRAFLRAWCYKSRVPFSKANYTEICRQAGVLPLTQRRDITDLLFLHKILHSQVNSSYLLECVCLHTPARATREPRVFRPPFARIDVCLHNYCYRVQNSYCDIVSRRGEINIDIFSQSFAVFRNSLWRAYTII